MNHSRIEYPDSNIYPSVQFSQPLSFTFYTFVLAELEYGCEASDSRIFVSIEPEPFFIVITSIVFKLLESFFFLLLLFRKTQKNALRNLSRIHYFFLCFSKSGFHFIFFRISPNYEIEIPTFCFSKLKRLLLLLLTSSSFLFSQI